MTNERNDRDVGQPSQPAGDVTGLQDPRHLTIPPTDVRLDAIGETCSTLTPLIRARMRDLASGQVLVVSTDDPAARAGVPSWSRLTGNELVATAQDGTTLHFYLRKR
jgi:tRNA 2-thiouridine synthesizing protein A